MGLSGMFFRRMWAAAVGYRRPIANFGTYRTVLEGNYGLEIGGRSYNFVCGDHLPIDALVGGIGGCNLSRSTLWGSSLEDGQPYVYDRRKIAGANTSAMLWTSGMFRRERTISFWLHMRLNMWLIQCVPVRVALGVEAWWGIAARSAGQARYLRPYASNHAILSSFARLRQQCARG